ncbi:MAG: hypothetical protein K5986_09450 [Clostridium sp.]|uniref:hypothetical protein n=1 Tax=Clostridium sp. DSM 8431 TaxID=1761781 RepID=UPI0008E0B289|nr:hypothetical protein [Clostridium sp. DSM 8431]MCR4944654.1 hypothetical protein [Clostridium sp.]SFU87777.1 hypothetical protein SAMN04487886_12552 [Clostridium sp. DSM 8431]
MIDKLKMQRLYKERGLLDYQLQTLDDAFFIHGIKPNQVEGYSKLKDDEKKVFKEFIVSYLNSIKLEEREVAFLKVSSDILDFLKVEVLERGAKMFIFVKWES